MAEIEPIIAPKDWLPRPHFRRPDFSTPHGFKYYPEKSTIVWARLEAGRVKQLGFEPDNYLKYFSVRRNNAMSAQLQRGDLSDLTGLCSGRPEPTQDNTGTVLFDETMHPKRKGVNILAPFTTLRVKPTCGYYFNFQTDNKRRNFGIPAADLVKWRTTTTHHR